MRTIPSDAPAPTERHHGTPTFIKAMLSTAVLVLALAFFIGIVQLGDSPEYSAASGMTSETGSMSSQETATPATTSTPSAPQVVIVATETPVPMRAPKSTTVAIPTCPAPDQNDRDRICSIATLVPTPRTASVLSTPKPRPTCGTTAVDACLMVASDGG